MSTLLADIEAFIQTHGLKETRFGAEALNDKHLVRQLRKGRWLRPPTEARVRRYMSTYLPPELRVAAPEERAAA